MGVTMNFPDRPFDDAGEYVLAYTKALREASATVDPGMFRRAAEVLRCCIARNATIFTCGNGGSAAIANHMVCDHTKGVRADTGILPRVHSLVANIEINTAIANDVSYDQVFAFQLESYASLGDVLVAISSSGNSANIVNALVTAKNKGLTTIAMTGFAGGRARELADIALHVGSRNYGIVEDLHQSLMHGLAQFLRQHHIADKSLVSSRTF